MELTTGLLSVLRCPETKQPLALATQEQLPDLNVSLAKSDEPPVEAALINEDTSVAYPIDDGYPVLLLSRQIRLATE